MAVSGSVVLPCASNGPNRPELGLFCFASNTSLGHHRGSSWSHIEQPANGAVGRDRRWREDCVPTNALGAPGAGIQRPACCNEQSPIALPASARAAYGRSRCFRSSDSEYAATD